MTDQQWQPTTITTLETVWPLLEAPLQTALEPYKDAAAWFQGPLPLWPPLGIMVENVDAQRALMATLQAYGVSGVTVLCRLDASTAGLGMDAYHLALDHVVVGHLIHGRTLSNVLGSTLALMEKTKLDSTLATLWQLLASLRFQKPLGTCSPTELQTVQADSQAAIKAVHSTLGQAPPVLQSQATELQSAPAPLQLLPARAPEPAPVIEPRPFGFHNAAQARRDADKAWDLYWGQAPRYL